MITNDTMLFLGAYYFTGEADELLAGYRRLRAGFPSEPLDLHVCARTPDGIVVFDACPSEDVFRAFSSSAEFAAARRAAGLPEPVVAPIGEVLAAELQHRVGP